MLSAISWIEIGWFRYVVLECGWWGVLISLMAWGRTRNNFSSKFSDDYVYIRIYTALRVMCLWLVIEFRTAMWSRLQLIHVNKRVPGDVYIGTSAHSSAVHAMTCRLSGAKPLTVHWLISNWTNHQKTSVKCESIILIQGIVFKKCRLQMVAILFRTHVMQWTRRTNIGFPSYGYQESILLCLPGRGMAMSRPSVLLWVPGEVATTMGKNTL